MEQAIPVSDREFVAELRQAVERNRKYLRISIGALYWLVGDASVFAPSIPFGAASEATRVLRSGH
jgi:hypothetical protein